MTLGNISFGPLHHSTLGFDRFFKDFEDIIESNFQKTGSGFPPHNIIKRNRMGASSGAARVVDRLVFRTRESSYRQSRQEPTRTRVFHGTKTDVDLLELPRHREIRDLKPQNGSVCI